MPDLKDEYIKILGPLTGDDPTIREFAYKCMLCNVWSLKNEWGPGRITCPQCKKIAPSNFDKEVLKSSPRSEIGDHTALRRPECGFESHRGHTDSVPDTYIKEFLDKIFERTAHQNVYHPNFQKFFSHEIHRIYEYGTLGWSLAIVGPDEAV